MNYRHIYHAGNFADAFKHIILIALTKSFLNKESPFCYIETHAGTGRYDLSSKAAQVNREFIGGVSKIMAAANPPPLIKNYLDCVNQINSKGALRFYPGSPYFVKHLLRAQDQMILNELHPDDFQSLRKCFTDEENVLIHKQDGYQSLKALLPPKQRRGFVLLDPPYEKIDESQQLTKTLREITQRWPTGVFALWYPIKNRRTVDLFLTSLTSNISQPTLIAELSIHPENTEQHLNGSGMIVINPPWKLEEEIKSVLPWLWQTLSSTEQGRYSLQTNN